MDPKHLYYGRAVALDIHSCSLVELLFLQEVLLETDRDPLGRARPAKKVPELVATYSQQRGVHGADVRDVCLSN